MKTIKGVNVKNKKVLVRVDFDVAFDKKGRIADDLRIKTALPTIDYLIKNKAKVILMGHSGRPDPDFKNDRKKFSLSPIAKHIKNMCGLTVKFINDCVGEKVEKEVNKLKNGEVLLLENLRFYAGEKKNDLKFSRQLAGLGDLYVNNAFANSHRRHASMVGVTRFLPSYAGLTLVEEIKTLSRAIKKPKKPAVAIIGGAKIETKLSAIGFFNKKYNYVLIGGKIGLGVKRAGNNVILPLDYRGEEKFDIGDKTILKFEEIIKQAKTIVWNGPMGMFEDERYSKGTSKITEAVAGSKAFKIAGGGDTIAALNKYKLFNKMDFISTGGGSMLELLAGKKLPAVEALKNNKIKKYYEN